jgi:hypothetical protein
VTRAERIGSSWDRRPAIPWVVRRIAVGSPQDASVIHALILRRSADGDRAQRLACAVRALLRRCAAAQEGGEARNNRSGRMPASVVPLAIAAASALMTAGADDGGGGAADRRGRGSATQR